MIEYLRLFRVSNVFSAVSNILAGYLLAAGNWNPVAPLFLLIVASCNFYFAGMVLNDVFDYEQDKQQRPNRPLPSGKISLGRARTIGFSMLFLGVIFSAAAGAAGDSYSSKPLIVGIVLATMIILYDGGGKKTVVGPLLMGSCRTLNVLLGCSVATSSSSVILGFPSAGMVVALGIGVYVCGITIFAKRESESSSRKLLVTGMLVVFAGLIAIGSVPGIVNGFDSLSKNETIFMITIGMILFVVMRRMLTAVSTPNPQLVQVAVIVSLISLIMIDAAVCYYAAPDNLAYCITVALLMLPTFLMARWINPT